MADTLFNLLWMARYGSPAVKAAALADATVYLQSLSPHDAGNQLMYQGANGSGVLHLLSLFSSCEQAASLLSLVIERGRESCGTTALMSLLDAGGRTALHSFAVCCSDLFLTKVVLRENPPSLAVLDNDGQTPLHDAEHFHGSTSENAVFLRAPSAAFNASDYATLEILCGGSSPYLAREIRRQALALRAAVAISLKRSVAAPSALISRESGVALSILGRVRDADGAGHLLRYVLDFVGPQAAPYDSGWMEREYQAQAATIREQAATVRELAAANKELAAANRELAAKNRELVATISKHTE